LQAEADCKSNGFERNSETKICSDNDWVELVETQEVVQNAEADCLANSGTRYAENEVCITE
jgi:hypothetical protein